MTFQSSQWRAALLAAAGSALLTATIAVQHPNPLFGRITTYDKTGLFLPNWRFFAPNPAAHDYEILYRHDGESAGIDDPDCWHVLDYVVERRVKHTVWFPERRPMKAVFDAVSGIISLMGDEYVTPEKIINSVPAMVLRSMVEGAIDSGSLTQPPGYQLAVLSSSGYCDGDSPEIIYASPYIRLGAREGANG